MSEEYLRSSIARVQKEHIITILLKTTKPEKKSEEACLLAYFDVRHAFQTFLDKYCTNNRPFVLVGHGQGSEHVLQLVKVVIEKDIFLTRRLVAAYVGGVQVDQQLFSTMYGGGTFPMVNQMVGPFGNKYNLNLGNGYPYPQVNQQPAVYYGSSGAYNAQFAVPGYQIPVLNESNGINGICVLNVLNVSDYDEHYQRIRDNVKQRVERWYAAYGLELCPMYAAKFAQDEYVRRQAEQIITAERELFQRQFAPPLPPPVVGSCITCVSPGANPNSQQLDCCFDQPMLNNSTEFVQYQNPVCSEDALFVSDLRELTPFTPNISPVQSPTNCLGGSSEQKVMFRREDDMIQFENDKVSNYARRKHDAMETRFNLYSQPQPNTVPFLWQEPQMQQQQYDYAPAQRRNCFSGVSTVAAELTPKSAAVHSQLKNIHTKVNDLPWNQNQSKTLRRNATSGHVRSVEAAKQARVTQMRRMATSGHMKSNEAASRAVRQAERRLRSTGTQNSLISVASTQQSQVSFSRIAEPIAQAASLTTLTESKSTANSSADNNNNNNNDPKPPPVNSALFFGDQKNLSRPMSAHATRQPDAVFLMNSNQQWVSQGHPITVRENRETLNDKGKRVETVVKRAEARIQRNTDKIANIQKNAAGRDYPRVDDVDLRRQMREVNAVIANVHNNDNNNAEGSQGLTKVWSDGIIQEDIYNIQEDPRH